MGKLKYFLFSILLLISLFPALTLAAPSPWGIAINDEKQECAGYWAGDEFSYYSLPQGWTSYVPDYDEAGQPYIETPYGRCDFSGYSEESCCLELDLPYLTNQIGNYHATGFCPDCLTPQDYTPILAIVLTCCCILLGLVSTGILFVLKKRKVKKNK